MRQPTPIKNHRSPKEIFGEFCRRSKATNDPVAVVLTTHLFTEHWLNQILRRFCPNFDLTDYRKTELTYAQKLHVIYSLDKLPKELFENLKRLNKLRNNIAHDIDFDLTKMDLNYHPFPLIGSEFVVSGFKPSYDPAAKQHHLFNVLGLIAAHTLFWLQDYSINTLGLKNQSLISGRYG